MPLGIDLPEPERTDVTDELVRAGGSFGTLIESVGNAVAATQERLDQTGAETAEALATTLVDVIAVREQVYNDSGQLTTSTGHVLELPLITQVAPSFHWWQEVRLQGTFFAREVSTRTDSRSRVAGASISLGTGRGLSASGFAAGTNVSVGQTSDVSVGQIRMNALLEARDDVAIPQPRRSIRGPRLSIFLGQAQTETTQDEPPRIVGRTLEATVELRSAADDQPVPGATISIEAPGLDWSPAVPPPADQPVVTDGSGRIPIVLERRFPEDETDTAPRDFVLTARVGLVSASTTVSL